MARGRHDSQHPCMLVGPTRFRVARFDGPDRARPTDDDASVSYLRSAGGPNRGWTAGSQLAFGSSSAAGLAVKFAASNLTC